MSKTHPSLIGKKHYLRPTVLEDMAVIQRWKLASDPQALSCRPVAIVTEEDAVKRFKRRVPTKNRQRLAIIRKKDDVLVGAVSFFNYNALNRSMELGIIVDPAERRKGHAKAAVNLLCGYLFRSRGLNKVYAQTAAFNRGAVELLDGLGFKRDAVLRDHYFYNGQFFDGLIYSLLLFEYE